MTSLSEEVEGADLDFLILHALRLKGTADMEGLRAQVGRDVPDAVLERLVADGLVLAVGSRYALAEPGEERHKELLAERSTESARATLGERYDTDFLPLNRRFKELCSAWQTEGDFELLEAFEEVNEELESFLSASSREVAHLGRYPSRFQEQFERFMDGSSEAMTAPIGESYHNIWFELHEDLIVTLGRSRADEEA